ncbi:MAG: hypothetical protein E7478_00275 [Ruminococcaceae bacterium]|nr:hypothetical protein [Oscillospiraceae bacterium]
MLKKLAALLLSAIISVSAVTVSVSAEDMQTASVTREAEASYIKWSGKTAMQAGKNYIVTSDVTISKKVTIPSGTTLVVQKGAKLWISTKGALYIKGKLNIKSGATLAVSGTLYQYKSKTLANYGEMRFGSKAKVTLNGKVYIYSKGTVTGTPKSLSVGANAAFSCTGKNSCAKLDKYIDRTAIEKQLETAFTKAVKSNDIYGTVSTLFCKEHIAAIDAAFAATGSTLKAYCDEYSKVYKAEMKEEGVDSAKVKSVDVKATKLTAKKTLTGDAKTIADAYYKGGKVYEAACTVTVKTSSDTVTEDIVILVAEKNGKWYMLGE